MNGIKKLNVYYHDRLVGTLAELKTKETAFEYDDTWLTDGFPISPFGSGLLKKEVFIAKMGPF